MRFSFPSGLALASIVILAIGAVPARAEPAKRPNVLVILADDKYESAGPKAEKHAKKQLKTGFCARF